MRRPAFFERSPGARARHGECEGWRARRCTMALEAVEIGTMNGDVYEVEHELPAREVNRNGNGLEREIPLARKVNGKANGIERQLPSDGAARDALTVPLAPATRKVKVVEVGTGIEHELPGDTATRD